jgi:hypothetical protein
MLGIKLGAADCVKWEAVIIQPSALSSQPSALVLCG